MNCPEASVSSATLIDQMKWDTARLARQQPDVARTGSPTATGFCIVTRNVVSFKVKKKWSRRREGGKDEDNLSLTKLQ